MIDIITVSTPSIGVLKDVAATIQVHGFVFAGKLVRDFVFVNASRPQPSKSTRDIIDDL